MILEDVVKDVVGGEEVFSEDGVDGGEGAAEVFGDEVGGEAGAHGSEDVAEGGGRLGECLEVALVCDKGRICVGDEVLFGREKRFFQFLKAGMCFCRD